MPQLNVATLIVVFVASNMLVGSLMLAAFHGRLTPVLRLWVASLFTQGVGWVFMTQCGTPGALYGYVIVSFSHCLMLHALIRHFSISHRYSWAYWPFALTLLFWILESEVLWQRQMAANLISALQILMVGIVFLSWRGNRTALRNVIGGCGVIAATMLTARAFQLYQTESTVCVVNMESQEQGLMFLCFLVFRFAFMFGFLLLIEDKHREVVSRLAMLDPLTEAYNRRTFIELAERELQRCQRYGKSLSLIVLDLDHFKQVNDTLGHQAGDAVLKHVRVMAEQCLRTHDIFARYGGEEFIILAPETGPEGGKVLAERLRAAIAGTPVGGGLAVTASVGVASRESGSTGGLGSSLDNMIAEADRAMYTAKAAGRNCVVMAT